jgi:Effector Associated Constant Component 1
VVQVRLVLGTGDRDQEGTEEDLQYLSDELQQIDGVKVGREIVPASPGTRGGGVDAGAVILALGGSGATLPVLVALIRDWLARRGSGVVRLKIGSDEVELTRASGTMQQQALDEFLRRHQG